MSDIGRVRRGYTHRAESVNIPTGGSSGAGGLRSRAWDMASQSLDKGFDSLARGLMQREEFNRRREREEQRVSAAMAKDAREAMEAAEAAGLNKAIGDFATESQQPGFQGPEGEIQGAESQFTHDPAETLEFQTQVAAQAAEGQIAAAEHIQKIEDKVAKESTEVERKDAQIMASANRSAQAFLNSKDARDTRVRNMEETELLRQQGKDISQIVAADRQQAKIESLLAKKRADLDDDGKLYTSLTTEWNRNTKAAGGRTSGRDAEDARDAWARERMRIKRLDSGFYSIDETGSVDWDDEKAMAAAVSAVPTPLVKPGSGYTEEDYARAREIRYSFPQGMTQWTAKMWEAQGLDPALAIQMAAHAGRQAARLRSSEPVRSADGRAAPIDPSVRSQGLTGAGAIPARPDALSSEEDKELEAISGAARRALEPDDSMGVPPGAAEPTPPLAPSPAPGAAPTAPPADPTAEATAAPEDPSSTWLSWLTGVKHEDLPSVRELFDQSDIEKDLEATFTEGLTAAYQRIAADPLTALAGPFGMARAQAKKEKEIADQAKAKAKKVSDLTVELASLGEKDSWDEAAKLNRAQEIQGHINEITYGSDIANTIKAFQSDIKKKIENGADPIEAQEDYRQRLLKVIEHRRREARGAKLDARSAQTSAAWDQLEGTLTDPKEFGKFVLTTGLPMIVATATGAAGVGIVGRLALTAFTAGGMDLAMQGGVLDENGRFDAERVRSSAIEGLTSGTELPAVGAISRLAKAAAGQGLKGKIVNMALAGLAEGVEEPFQNILASLADKGEFPSGAELLVASALAAPMGTALGVVLTTNEEGTNLDAKSKKLFEKQLDQALELVRANNPELLNEDFLSTLEEGELQERLAPYAAEVQANLEQQSVEEGYDDASLMAKMEAEAASQATEVDYGDAQADVREEVEAAVEQEAELETVAKDPAKAKPGQRVETPAEFEPLLPKSEWRKVDDSTIETQVEGVRLQVQTGQEGLVLRAAEGAAEYGAEGDVAATGLFKPAELNVSKTDMIQMAAGQGRQTATHEFVHFLRKNGLISGKDWATLSTRYQKRAMEQAVAAGQKWGSLKADQKALFLEEGVAEAMGDYVRSLHGDKPIKAPKPIQKLAQFVRGLARKVSGAKNDAEFDRLLAGEYSKAPVQDSATFKESGQRAQVDTERRGVVPFSTPTLDAGWKGERTQHGTIGLKGPAGEKVGLKLDGKTVAVKSIGKGQAANSRGLVKAIRDFAKARKADRIVMSSTQSELTPAARKWREGMVGRGEALYNENGEFELTLEAPKAGARAQAVAIDDKGNVNDPVAQQKNLAYYLATVARLKGKEVPGNVGAKSIPEPKAEPQKVAGTMLGRVSNADWLKRVTDNLGGVGSEEWNASMGWYKDLRAAFVKEFGEAQADKYLVLWGVSQQRASASKGLSDVFRAEDIAKGFAKEGTAGLASDRMVSLLKGDKGSLGQKLADFMDSIRGKLTRSWVGDDPRAGQPAAFDIWAMRDVGYVDETMKKWAAKHGVDLEVDSTQAPSDAQYHYGLKRYQDFAAYLNQKKVQGRTDWRAAEAQALGWMSIQKVVGANPETVADVFGKNKATLVAEVNPSPTLAPELKKQYDALSQEQQRKVTDAVLSRVLPMAATATGVRIQGHQQGQGLFQGSVAENGVVEVLGREDQIQGFTDLLAQTLNQDEVWSMKLAAAEHKKSAIIVDVTGVPKGQHDSVYASVFGMVAGEFPGYTVMPDGTMRFAVLTNPTETRIAAQEQKIMDLLRMFGDDTMKAEVGGAQLLIGKGGKNEGGSPRRVDGVEGVADISDAYQEAFSEAIAEARPGARAQVAEEPSAWRSTLRRLTKPVLERLREIKSVGGREIGTVIADQVSNRQEYIERNVARLRHGYKKALGAFKAIEGKSWEQSWDQVVSSLDGKVSFKDLNPAQKKLYTVVRAIFNKVKTDAITNDTFTGQIINRYFPHMRTDVDFDPIDEHASWLRQNDPKRFEALRATDEEWISGILGQDASDYELAAKDLARNWDKESWWKRNSHLEKHRGDSDGAFRRDSDVVNDYINGAYNRIGTARFFGPKSEMVHQAMQSLKRGSDDAAYVKESLQTVLGFNRSGPGLAGRAVKNALREVQALSGLTKLANAWIPQLSQIAVAGSEAMTPGFKRGLKNVVNAGLALTQQGFPFGQDASRAGSTFAADITLGGSEIQRAQYGAGTGSIVESVFKKILGKRIVESTFGVVPLDRMARVFADGIAREVYIDALRRGDRETLGELLGTPELVEQAMKQQGSADALLDGWRKGSLDEEHLVARMARPAEGDPQYVGKGLGYAKGVELMDRAAKRFSDKTQYRTRAQDAPLAFQTPTLKTFNTFLSFMYQHWRWQATHAKGMMDKSAPDATRRRHARALMAQNLIMGPFFGHLAFSVRALVTGRGQDEEDKEFLTPGEAFDAVMGVDPIKPNTATRKWLRYLQAWQYSGGLGYPMTLIERWRRTATSFDRGSGISSLVGGAPGQSVYETGDFAVEAWNVATKWADGRATTEDLKRLKRKAINITGHFVPNPLGLAGSARAQARATEDRPATDPGWLGFWFDPEARWTLAEGVTSPTSERATREREEERIERRLREKERAEEDAADRRKGR